MADIRINALATTAASTASDDFVAVDGSANGTRKLNAFSPTFGGNLTVSGTGTHSFAGQVTSFANSANAANFGSFVASNATLHSFTSYSPSASLDQKYWLWQAGTAVGDGTFRLRATNDAGTNGINALIITRTGISSTAVEVGGNLTVSGGTISSGTATLTLKSTSNTVVLQSAGTTALTLDASQNATFAGTDVTVNGGSTSSNLTLKRASNSFGAVVNYNTTTTNKWFHGLRGLTNDNWYLFNNVAGNNALIFDAATSDATFGGKITTSAPTGGAGAWELGVYTATAPTATGYVTIEIGGVQYKLLAST